jgi:uncharacterized protein YhfF
MTRLPISYSFGSSPEIADNRLALVIAGKKTATCNALSSYSPDDTTYPEIGVRNIVLDGKGSPAAVIETVKLRTVAFNQVDEDHAVAEGYPSLIAWRLFHEAGYRREGIYAPDMLILCEYFRLVEILTH